jgi:uncharacterized protein (TIGR02284 family)
MVDDRTGHPGYINQPTTIEALNQLAVVCGDSAHLFQAAHEALSNDLLRALLGNYAQQRTHFTIALRAEIHRQGGMAEERSSLQGTLHRGWLNIKSALTGGDEQAIVSECLRQEEVVLQTYDDVCHKMDLPADVLALVERQYKELRLIYTNLRRIEERINILL